MAIANDKAMAGGTVVIAGQAPMTAYGKATASLKNIFAMLGLPLYTAGKHNAPLLWGETTPVGDTNCGSLPIGSVYLQLSQSAGTVNGFVIWAKEASGATGWRKVQTSASSESHVVVAIGDHTCAGGDTTEVITATNVLSTDKVIMEVISNGVNSVTINTYSVGDGTITATTNRDPQTDHVFRYIAYRARAS